MPQFKALIFSTIGLKLSYFCTKIANSPRTGELRPQTPLPPAVGGAAPEPQMASCGRDCSYLIDNSFIVIFYSLFAILSTLALVKYLIV